MATPQLHGGTVTFLFTDIEGSTRLLKALGADYGEVLEEHRRILRAAFVTHGGQEVDTQGDSFFFAFRQAKQAVAAALDAQRALAAHAWPEGIELRVRMGLHSGEPVLEEGRYVGMGVHRAARIGAAAHGDQVLLSAATRELVEDDLAGGVSLRDLGLVRLKDIERPEHVFQLVADGLRHQFPRVRAAPAARPIHRRPVVIGAAASLLTVTVAIAVFALGGGWGGSVALAGVEGNAVGAVDLSRGRVVASVPVGTAPSSVAFGRGAIWVTNGDGHSVSRIDPTTNAVVQTIPVGSGPAGVAVGGGFVWVANSLDGTVSKIDPNVNNGTVVETPLVGNGPSGIAFGGGSVWVANSSDRTVMRIDPGSAAVRRTIPVGAGADAVAVGLGFVWVTSESTNSVTRINVRTGTVLPPISVGNGPGAIAVGAGSAWVANSLDGTVSRIDPREATARVIPVGAGPTGISVAGNLVWVSNERAGTLSRIDPARNRVVQTVRTGNRPEGLAVAANALYVAVRASGLAHRGGTLTVLEASPFDSLDPAVSYGGPSWVSMVLTNDGLTGYKRVGGSEGARLVPDLASSLPAPRDGGKTYTFQLRPGIRYSTGALVRPADFRRALERSVVNRAGTGFYFTGIVDADRCLKTPKRCDLSHGIVADPTSNTVTFHLAAPDPDFLHKLALPAAFAVPAGTRVKARLPLPATGPYMIASYNAKRGVRLVRNPRFHEWSAAAQPTGFPNEIVLRTGTVPEAQLGDVARGKGDLDLLQGVIRAVPGSRLSALQRQYASDLESNPTHAVFFVSLNTRLRPFNDATVRRAVNYAVDRNRVAEIDSGGAQPSCQVLPPNFDGYRRYCPYTIDPRADGKYTGPDLKKARQLVAASGTRGQAVTLWYSPFFPSAHAVGAYLVSTLQSLGYTARLKVAPDDATAAARSKFQAELSAWVADYVSASNFFSPLFCNEAQFCNPHIDTEIARARSLQISDPQAASEVWRRLDHDIVDQAPWVVLMNAHENNFLSPRVGNYQYNPQWRALLDQIWVK